MIPGERQVVYSNTQPHQFETKIITSIAPPKLPFIPFKTTLLVPFCNTNEVTNSYRFLLRAWSCLLPKKVPEGISSTMEYNWYCRIFVWKTQTLKDKEILGRI